MVSAALKAESIPERARLLARDEAQLWLSAPVFEDITEVLNRRKLMRAIPPERRQRIIRLLTENARFIAPTLRVADCQNPDDGMYLELALAAKAGFLVSGDADLLVLDPWRGIRIVKPSEFVRLWDSTAA